MPHDLEQLGSNGIAKDEPSKEIKRRENRGAKRIPRRTRTKRESQPRICNRVATTRYNSEITVSLPQNLTGTEVLFSSLWISVRYSRGWGEQENLEGKIAND